MSTADVVIEHLDGTEERVVLVARQVVADGALSLFGKVSGHMSDDRHLGSWPLASIKKWTRYPR